MAQARTRGTNGARDARVGSGTRIRGRIAGDGDLVIEGEVEGDVSIRGHLAIEAGGAVVSDVEAESVTVAGTLEGSVKATGPVRIASGGRVKGDLKGSEVSIDEGAQFSGRLDCEFDLPAELSEGSSPRGRR